MEDLKYLKDDVFKNILKYTDSFNKYSYNCKIKKENDVIKIDKNVDEDGRYTIKFVDTSLGLYSIIIKNKNIVEFIDKIRLEDNFDEECEIIKINSKEYINEDLCDKDLQNINESIIFFYYSNLSNFNDSKYSVDQELKYNFNVGFYIIDDTIFNKFNIVLLDNFFITSVLNSKNKRSLKFESLKLRNLKKGYLVDYNFSFIESLNLEKYKLPILEITKPYFANAETLVEKCEN